MQENAEQVAKDVSKRLKEALGREQFEVAIQAVVGGKVIAKTVPYGGENSEQQIRKLGF